MRTIADYLAKVTYPNDKQPNYMAVLAGVLQPFSDLQVFLNGMPSQFDLDSAIGAQLDVAGQWIGQSRNITIPIPDVWFSFGDANRGFGRGVWKGPYAQGTMIDALDDDTYRRLLKAKVLANSWDGTLRQGQAILNAFFNDPATYVFIEDRAQISTPRNFFAFGDPARGFGASVWYSPGETVSSAARLDISMAICVAGKIPSVVLLSILEQNLIPIKPAGVEADVVVTSVNGAPLFGFGAQNQYISGFGSGAWGVDPYAIIDLRY